MYNEVRSLKKINRSVSMCVGVFHTLVSGKIIRLKTHPNTAVYFREHEAHTGIHIVWNLRYQKTHPYYVKDRCCTFIFAYKVNTSHADVISTCTPT